MKRSDLDPNCGEMLLVGNGGHYRPVTSWSSGAAQQYFLRKRDARSTFRRPAAALANPAIELPADNHRGRGIIEELKTNPRTRLASLCRRAGISQPEVLADPLPLPRDGARVSRQAAGSKGPSAKFTATAEAVIATFKAKSKPARRSR